VPNLSMLYMEDKYTLMQVTLLEQHCEDEEDQDVTQIRLGICEEAQVIYQAFFKEGFDIKLQKFFEKNDGFLAEVDMNEEVDEERVRYELELNMTTITHNTSNALFNQLLKNWRVGFIEIL
jgi:hypothetical protein